MARRRWIWPWTRATKSSPTFSKNMGRRSESMRTHSVLSTFTSALLLLSAWSSLAFCGEIHDAAKAGDVEKVKALLKANPESVSSKDVLDGWTPLHWAAHESHKEVSEVLLACGANANLADNTWVTPLHIA